MFGEGVLLMMIAADSLKKYSSELIPLCSIPLTRLKTTIGHSSAKSAAISRGVSSRYDITGSFRAAWQLLLVFSQSTDGSSMKWIGRFRRDNESRVSEAVFFPIAAHRR
jgi:hypothetical protein